MERFILKHVVRLVVFGIILFITASTAQAGWDAFTTADVNMREGPGNQHRVIVVIPEGEPVYVHACPSRWCDVQWDGYRGSVYGRYLDGSGSDYYEGYLVSPPVIVTPDYDDGYIYVPRKRRHYHRHKRKRKYSDRHKRKRKRLDRKERRSKRLDREERRTKRLDRQERRSKRLDRKERRSKRLDREERRTKRLDRQERRSKRLDREERRSKRLDREERRTKRSENRRSMLRNSRRAEQRFERRRNLGDGRRGSQRRRNSEREDDD